MKLRDARIPEGAPPAVDVGTVARWFGVPKALVRHWYDRGWLGPAICRRGVPLLFGTDNIRWFAVHQLGVRIHGAEDGKGATGTEPGVSV